MLQHFTQITLLSNVLWKLCNISFLFLLPDTLPNEDHRHVLLIHIYNNSTKSTPIVSRLPSFHRLVQMIFSHNSLTVLHSSSWNWLCKLSSVQCTPTHERIFTKRKHFRWGHLLLTMLTFISFSWKCKFKFVVR